MHHFFAHVQFPPSVALPSSRAGSCSSCSRRVARNIFLHPSPSVDGTRKLIFFLHSPASRAPLARRRHRPFPPPPNRGQFLFPRRWCTRRSTLPRNRSRRVRPARPQPQRSGPRSVAVKKFVHIEMQRLFNISCPYPWQVFHQSSLLADV